MGLAFKLEAPIYHPQCSVLRVYEAEEVGSFITQSALNKLEQLLREVRRK